MLQPIILCILLAIFIPSGYSAPNKFQCSRYCKSDSTYGYKVGNNYIYKYEGTVKSMLNGTSGDDIEIAFNSDVKIRILTSCDFILELDNVQTLETSTSNGVKQSFTPDTQSEFADALSSNPLYFTFQNGKIETLCPADDELAWSLNVKKAILSMFQNSVLDAVENAIVYEMDVQGSCETYYTVTSNDNDNIIEVHKVKNLNTCSHRVASKSTMQSIPYLKKNTKTSLPALRSTQSCVKSFSNDKTNSPLLLNGKCDEKHVFQPFSNGEAGAITISTQKITYVDQTQDDFNVKGSYTKGRHSLLFEKDTTERNDSKITISYVMGLLKELDKLRSDGVEVKAPEVFAKIVKAMRTMNQESLVELFTKVFTKEQKHILIDAMPLIRTMDGIGAMKSLFKQNKLTQNNMNAWIESLAFIDEPSIQIIAELNTLFEKSYLNDLKHPILSLSTLVYRYCKIDYYCSKRSAIQKSIYLIEKNLRDSCAPKALNKHNWILTSLKGIGNAGITNSMNYLEKCIQNDNAPMDIRLAAVNAHRRIPCSRNTNYNVLLKTFADKKVDVELRIASYLSAMRCLSHSTFSEIKDVLHREDTNQVGSFVWTHLTNLQETSSKWKQGIRIIVENEFLRNKFNTDARKYSRNYEMSTFFDSLNTGVTLESNVIFTPESYLPRSGMLNLTVDIFGESVNLFEIGGRVEGFEDVVQKFFGPGGYFHDKSMDSALNKMRNETQNGLRNEVKEIGEDVQQQKQEYLKKDPRGMLYARAFGNEFIYKRFMNMNHLFNKRIDTASFLDFLKSLIFGDDIKYARSFDFIDTTYAVPTLLGFPLELSLSGSATVGLNVKGKLNITKNMMDVGAKIAPSAAVQIVGNMLIQSPLTRSGLSIISTINSNTYVDASIYMEAFSITDIKIKVPKQQTDIINIQSRLYVMRNDNKTEIKGIEENREHQSLCSGDMISNKLGLKFCSVLEYANASSIAEAPYFPLTGPYRYSVGFEKTDTFDVYQFKSFMETEDSATLSLLIDTPGSKVNRKTSLVITEKGFFSKFNLKYTSPYSSGLLSVVTNETNLNIQANYNDQKVLLFDLTRGAADDLDSYNRTMALHVEYYNTSIFQLHTYMTHLATDRYSINLQMQGSFFKKITLTGEIINYGNGFTSSVNLDSESYKGNGKFTLQFKNSELRTNLHSTYKYLDNEDHTLDTDLRMVNDPKMKSFLFKFKSSQIPQYNTKIVGSIRDGPRIPILYGTIVFNTTELHALLKDEIEKDLTNSTLSCSFVYPRKNIDYKIDFSHVTSDDKFYVNSLVQLSMVKRLQFTLDYNVNETEGTVLHTLDTMIYYPAQMWSMNSVVNKTPENMYTMSLNGYTEIDDVKSTVVSATGELSLSVNYFNHNCTLNIDFPAFTGYLETPWLITSSLEWEYDKALYQGQFKTKEDLHEIYVNSTKSITDSYIRKNNHKWFILNVESGRDNKLIVVGLNIYQHFEFFCNLSSTEDLHELFDVRFYWDKVKDKKVTFSTDVDIRHSSANFDMEYNESKLSGAFLLRHYEVTLNVTWGAAAPQNVYLKLATGHFEDGMFYSANLVTPFQYFESQEMTVKYSLTENEGTLIVYAKWQKEFIDLLIKGTIEPSNLNAIVNLVTTLANVKKCKVALHHEYELRNDTFKIINTASVAYNDHAIETEFNTLNDGYNFTMNFGLTSPSKSIPTINTTLVVFNNQTTHLCDGYILWNQNVVSLNYKFNHFHSYIKLNTPLWGFEESNVEYKLAYGDNQLTFDATLHFLKFRNKIKFLSSYRKNVLTVDGRISSTDLGNVRIFLSHNNGLKYLSESLVIERDNVELCSMELSGIIDPLVDLDLVGEFNVWKNRVTFGVSYKNNELSSLLNGKWFDNTVDSNLDVTFNNDQLDVLSWKMKSSYFKDNCIVYISNKADKFLVEVSLPGGYAVYNTMDYSQNPLHFDNKLHVTTPTKTGRIHVHASSKDLYEFVHFIHVTLNDKTGNLKLSIKMNEPTLMVEKVNFKIEIGTEEKLRVHYYMPPTDERTWTPKLRVTTGNTNLLDVDCKLTGMTYKGQIQINVTSDYIKTVFGTAHYDLTGDSKTASSEMTIGSSMYQAKIAYALEATNGYCTVHWENLDRPNILLKYNFRNGHKTLRLVGSHNDHNFGVDFDQTQSHNRIENELRFTSTIQNWENVCASTIIDAKNLAGNVMFSRNDRNASVEYAIQPGVHVKFNVKSTFSDVQNISFVLEKTVETNGLQLVSIGLIWGENVAKFETGHAIKFVENNDKRVKAEFLGSILARYSGSLAEPFECKSNAQASVTLNSQNDLMEKIVSIKIDSDHALLKVVNFDASLITNDAGYTAELKMLHNDSPYLLYHTLMLTDVKFYTQLQVLTPDSFNGNVDVQFGATNNSHVYVTNLYIKHNAHRYKHLSTLDFSQSDVYKLSNLHILPNVKYEMNLTYINKPQDASLHYQFKHNDVPKVESVLSFKGKLSQGRFALIEKHPRKIDNYIDIDFIDTILFRGVLDLIHRKLSWDVNSNTINVGYSDNDGANLLSVNGKHTFKDWKNGGHCFISVASLYKNHSAEFTKTVQNDDSMYTKLHLVVNIDLPYMEKLDIIHTNTKDSMEFVMKQFPASLEISANSNRYYSAITALPFDKLHKNYSAIYEVNDSNYEILIIGDETRLFNVKLADAFSDDVVAIKKLLVYANIANAYLQLDVNNNNTFSVSLKKGLKLLNFNVDLNEDVSSGILTATANIRNDFGHCCNHCSGRLTIDKVDYQFTVIARSRKKSCDLQVKLPVNDYKFGFELGIIYDRSNYLVEIIVTPDIFKIAIDGNGAPFIIRIEKSGTWDYMDKSIKAYIQKENTTFTTFLGYVLKDERFDFTWAFENQFKFLIKNFNINVERVFGKSFMVNLTRLNESQTIFRAVGDKMSGKVDLLLRGLIRLNTTLMYDVNDFNNMYINCSTTAPFRFTIFHFKNVIQEQSLDFDLTSDITTLTFQVHYDGKQTDDRKFKLFFTNFDIKLEIDALLRHSLESNINATLTERNSRGVNIFWLLQPTDDMPAYIGFSRNYNNVTKDTFKTTYAYKIKRLSITSIVSNFQKNNYLTLNIDLYNGDEKKNALIKIDRNAENIFNAHCIVMTEENKYDLDLHVDNPKTNQSYIKLRAASVFSVQQMKGEFMFDSQLVDTVKIDFNVELEDERKGVVFLPIKIATLNAETSFVGYAVINVELVVNREEKTAVLRLEREKVVRKLTGVVVTTDDNALVATLTLTNSDTEAEQSVKVKLGQDRFLFDLSVPQSATEIKLEGLYKMDPKNRSVLVEGSWNESPFRVNLVHIPGVNFQLLMSITQLMDWDVHIKSSASDEGDVIIDIKWKTSYEVLSSFALVSKFSIGHCEFVMDGVSFNRNVKIDGDMHYNTTTVASKVLIQNQKNVYFINAKIDFTPKDIVIHYDSLLGKEQKQIHATITSDDTKGTFTISNKENQEPKVFNFGVVYTLKPNYFNYGFYLPGHIISVISDFATNDVVNIILRLPVFEDRKIEFNISLKNTTIIMASTSPDHTARLTLSAEHNQKGYFYTGSFYGSNRTNSIEKQWLKFDIEKTTKDYKYQLVYDTDSILGSAFNITGDFVNDDDTFKFTIMIYRPNNNLNYELKIIRNKLQPGEFYLKLSSSLLIDAHLLDPIEPRLIFVLKNVTSFCAIDTMIRRMKILITTTEYGKDFRLEMTSDQLQMQSFELQATLYNKKNSQQLIYTINHFALNVIKGEIAIGYAAPEYSITFKVDDEVDFSANMCADRKDLKFEIYVISPRISNTFVSLKYSNGDDPLFVEPKRQIIASAKNFVLDASFFPFIDVSYESKIVPLIQNFTMRSKHTDSVIGLESTVISDVWDNWNIKGHFEKSPNVLAVDMHVLKSVDDDYYFEIFGVEINTPLRLTQNIHPRILVFKNNTSVGVYADHNCVKGVICEFGVGIKWGWESVILSFKMTTGLDKKVTIFGLIDTPIPIMNRMRFLLTEPRIGDGEATSYVELNEKRTELTFIVNKYDPKKTIDLKLNMRYTLSSLVIKQYNTSIAYDISTSPRFEYLVNSPGMDRERGFKFVFTNLGKFNFDLQGKLSIAPHFGFEYASVNLTHLLDLVAKKYFMNFIVCSNYNVDFHTTINITQSKASQYKSDVALSVIDKFYRLTSSVSTESDFDVRLKMVSSQELIKNFDVNVTLQTNAGVLLQTNFVYDNMPTIAIDAIFTESFIDIQINNTFYKSARFEYKNVIDKNIDVIARLCWDLQRKRSSQLGAHLLLKENIFSASVLIPGNEITFQHLAALKYVDKNIELLQVSRCAFNDDVYGIVMNYMLNQMTEKLFVVELKSEYETPWQIVKYEQHSQIYMPFIKFNSNVRTFSSLTWNVRGGFTKFIAYNLTADSSRLDTNITSDYLEHSVNVVLDLKNRIYAYLRYSPAVNDYFLFDISSKFEDAKVEKNIIIKYPQSKIDHALRLRMNDDVSNNFDMQLTLNYYQFKLSQMETFDTRLFFDYDTCELDGFIQTSRTLISVKAMHLPDENGMTGYSIQTKLNEKEPLHLGVKYSNKQNDPSFALSSGYGSKIFTLYFGVPSNREITAKLTHKLYGDEVNDGLFSLRLNNSKLLWAKLQWTYGLPSTFKRAVLHEYDDILYVFESMGNDVINILDDDIGKQLLYDIQYVYVHGAKFVIYEYDTLKASYNKYIMSVLEWYNSNEFYVRTIVEAIFYNPVAEATYEACASFFELLTSSVTIDLPRAFDFLHHLYRDIKINFGKAATTFSDIETMKKDAKKYMKELLVKWSKSLDASKEIVLGALNDLNVFVTNTVDSCLLAIQPTLDLLDDVVGHIEQKLTVLQLNLLEYLDSLQSYFIQLEETKTVISAYITYVSWLEEIHITDVLEPIGDFIESALDIILTDLKSVMDDYKQYIDALLEAIVGKYDMFYELPAVVELRQTSSNIYQRTLWIWNYHNVTEHIKNYVEDIYKDLDGMLDSASYILDGSEDYKFVNYEIINDSNYTFRPDIGLIEIKQVLPIDWHSFQELPQYEAYPFYPRMSIKGQNIFEKNIKKYSKLNIIDYLLSEQSNDVVKPVTNNIAILIGTDDYVTFNHKYYRFASGGSYVLISDLINNAFAVAINYEIENGAPKKKSITVIAFENNFELLTNGTVLLNGIKTELPLENSQVLIVRDEFVVTIDHWKGLKITCNLYYDMCTFELSSWHFGRVGGLLGTMDNEKITDMTMSTGDKTSDVEKFVQSWRIKSQSYKSNVQTVIVNKPLSPLMYYLLTSKCKNSYMFEYSPLSACFEEIDPTPFYEICIANAKRTADDNKLCAVSFAYKTMCKKLHGFNVDLGKHCDRCKVDDGNVDSTIGKGEIQYTNDHSPGIKSTDVVLIVHPKCKYSTSNLAALLDVAFNAEGIADNRYAVVNYADVLKNKWVSYTSGGKIWNKAGDIADAHAVLNTNSQHYFLKEYSFVDVLKFINTLNYRKGVPKTIISTSCYEDHTMFNANDHNAIKDIVNKDVKFHIFKQNPDKDYRIGDVLVSITNGTMVSSKPDEKWATSVAKSFQSTPCHSCQCVTKNDGVPHLECKSCMPPTVKYLMTVYESGNMEFNL